MRLMNHKLYLLPSYYFTSNKSRNSALVCDDSNSKRAEMQLFFCTVNDFQLICGNLSCLVH